MALTRGSQRLRLTVNVQIGFPGPILQGFRKLGDQICELNYRRTKYEIGDKLRDQKCNFALILLILFECISLKIFGIIKIILEALVLQSPLFYDVKS